MQESESYSYITVKDHKKDLLHKILCRLINSSKPDIGKISKIIVDRANTIFLELDDLNP